MAAACAVALLVAGCGGHKSGRRAAVSNYIQRINRIEQTMRGPLLGVAKAYRSFSTRSLSRARPRVVRAERTLRTLDARLRAVSPPLDAQHLHGLLLRLTATEIGLASEVVQLTDFLPRFDNALRPLGPANVTLARALGAAKAPKPKLVRGTRKQIAAARAAFARAVAHAEREQAVAVDAYVGTIDGAVRRLRALRPPPVFAPAYRSELQTLARLRGTGAALAEALRKGQRPRVATLGVRFGEAARSGGTLAAQRAEIAAVKEYDRRVHSVVGLTLRIDRERSRLERKVQP